MSKVTITGTADLTDYWKLLIDEVAKGQMKPEDAKAAIDAKCKWLRLHEVEYEVAGKAGQWTFAKRPTKKVGAKADVVIVVPILHEGTKTKKLVVLKEYRIPLQDYEYHFCAGLLEAGEDVVKAAERELLEETGFKLTDVICVSSPLISSSGLSDEDAIMVFCNCVEDKKQSLEETEDIDVLRLDYAGICDMLDARTTMKISAKTWLVLYMYQQLGSL